jgi:hypothetical protein
LCSFIAGAIRICVVVILSLGGIHGVGVCFLLAFIGDLLSLHLVGASLL